MDADELFPEDRLARFATRWWPHVYRLAWNMLGNPREAAAVTEEVLLAGLRLREPGVRVRTFLYRLAVRLAAARPRRRAAPSPIREALAQLDPLDRAALLLRDVEELALEESAAILETSVQDLRERAHRARLLLMGLPGWLLKSRQLDVDLARRRSA